MKVVYRRAILFCIIASSLLLRIGHVTLEVYPGKVSKPASLKWLTSIGPMVEVAMHAILFSLVAYPEHFDKYSESCVVAVGGLCALIKLIECALICHLVDEGLPRNRAGWFCLFAPALAQGLAVAAVGMAHVPDDAVPFDGPGKVFSGFGDHSFCPLLTTKEKRTLIEAILLGIFASKSHYIPLTDILRSSGGWLASWLPW